MKAASRLSALRPPLIREISEGAPPGSVPFGLGEPTWPLPEPARRALASLGARCPYGPNAGLPELRGAIGAFHGVGPERVLVTSGSEEALFALFLGWLEPGSAALVPDPGFTAYPSLAALCGADCVRYPLAREDRFRLDADALIAALEAAPRARLVVLNLPANPTGGAGSEEALRRVAEACAERDVVLVSDEVYRDLWFQARPPSLADVTPRGVVVSSVSKAFGAPGLRVGWAVGDPETLAPAAIVHAYAVTAAALPSQRAALALLEHADEVAAAGRSEVRARFDALAEAFREHLGRAIEPPDGGFYHWLPLPESARADPVAFCLRARDEGRVVLIPGLAFGEEGRGHARLSFAAPPDEIAEGARRLAPFLAEP